MFPFIHSSESVWRHIPSPWREPESSMRSGWDLFTLLIRHFPSNSNRQQVHSLFQRSATTWLCGYDVTLTCSVGGQSTSCLNQNNHCNCWNAGNISSLQRMLNSLKGLVSGWLLFHWESSFSYVRNSLMSQKNDTSPAEFSLFFAEV